MTCCNNKYNFSFKYKRILIIPGITFIILPLIVDEVRLVAWIALLYFFGSFMLLINFPQLSTMLQSKPIYYEDLLITDETRENSDNRFKITYELTMIFFLSILISTLGDYIYINGITNKQPVELLGIIGGNISIYLRLQNIIGKTLLKIFYFCKTRKEKELMVTINN
jgi:hypothetical protein